MTCVSVAPAAADDDEDPHWMIFHGRDLWRNGAFLHGGAVFAPGGFERDGFLLKGLIAVGAYRYNARSLGGEEVFGAEGLVAIMPGFRIKRGNVELKFFTGPEFRTTGLWPEDPDNRLVGDALGLRMAAELWAEPTPETMIAADASLASIGAGYAARAAAGLRLFNLFYAGPETQVYGGGGYAQYRFGGHITSMKTTSVEWSAGLGWARDTDSRSGGYARLGMLWKLR